MWRLSQKNAGTPAQGVNKQHRQAYRAIKEVSQGHHGAVTKLLDIVGVSRQAYHKGLNRQVSLWEVRDKQLKERTQYWFDFHHQGIGADNLLVNLRKDELIDFPITIKRDQTSSQGDARARYSLPDSAEAAQSHEAIRTVLVRQYPQPMLLCGLP